MSNHHFSNKRRRDIYRQRLLGKLPSQIGQEYGISREYVHVLIREYCQLYNVENPIRRFHRMLQEKVAKLASTKTIEEIARLLQVNMGKVEGVLQQIRKNGTHITPVRSQRKNLKIQKEDYEKIIKRRSSGETLRSIAKDYTCSDTYISNICTGNLFKYRKGMPPCLQPNGN